MNRVSGTMAVLAGLVLMVPGFFALLHAGSTGGAIPGWIVRDLVISSLSGAALMLWGASHIRHRELELNDVKPVRVRARR